MRPSTLLMIVAVGCGSAEPPKAHPVAEFPSLEPFVASRMWTLFGERSVEETVRDLREIRSRDGELDPSDQAERDGPDPRLKPIIRDRRAFLIPSLVAPLQAIAKKDAWTEAETALVGEAAAFLSELGAPEVRANHRGLAELAGWIRDYASTPSGYASMIFTVDYGPFVGLPVPEGAQLEKQDEHAFGDGFKLELCRRDEEKDPWVLRGTRNGQVLWTRIASADGALRLLDRPATNVGPYGWKLHLMTGGEYFHLYLDPDGGLLFYFFSW